MLCYGTSIDWQCHILPVTVYHLLLWFLECTMVEIEVLAPHWNRNAVQMSSVKTFLCMFTRFCGALVPKSPLLNYANEMLPGSTTLLPEMTQTVFEQLTAWPCTGEASLLLCNFPLSSNTTCILMFVGRIFRECLVSENFSDYIFTWDILCLKILDPSGLPL